MAWMVRSDEYPEGIYRLQSMPTMEPTLSERYEGILRARLDNFPTNEEELIEIPDNAKMAPNTFRHQFRY